MIRDELQCQKIKLRLDGILISNAFTLRRSHLYAILLTMTINRDLILRTTLLFLALPLLEHVHYTGIRSTIMIKHAAEGMKVAERLEVNN